MNKFIIILTFSLLANSFLFAQNIQLPANRDLIGKSVRLNDEDLLQTFFPAPVYREVIDEDTCLYTLWTCSGCDTIRFASWLDPEWILTFPREYTTQTEIFNKIIYTEGHATKALIFFQSHDRRDCDVGTGRGHCPIVSCASLSKQDQRWIIDSFNPTLGCYGNFGNGYSPKLYKDSISDRAYFIMKNSNSWNGGMFAFSNYHFFQIRQQQGLVSADALSFFDYMSGMTGWESKIQLLHENNESKFEIITTGNIDRENSQLPKNSELPIFIQRILKTQKPKIKFTYRSIYKFNSENKLILEKVEKI